MASVEAQITCITNVQVAISGPYIKEDLLRKRTGIPMRQLKNAVSV